MDRRTALKHLATAPFVAGGALSALQSAASEQSGRFRISTFTADITPPIGSPLCGGWIKPAQAVDDRLQARGIVLFGGDKPIVLCAIDWVENNNSTYDAWRAALAAAAGTTPSHVAVHCVHPHNTPWADIAADKVAQAVDSKLEVVGAGFVKTAIMRSSDALRDSLTKAKPITHVGTGQGRVEQVASNRRILGPDGKIAMMRMSKSSDAKARSAPEGLIDPYLKTVSFWNEGQPVVAMHYYATHPMSYYGDGHVTTDFCGLARNQRQQEQPDIFQLYFTGCAGNIAAGKYNDGSHEMRPILRDRVHAGMVAAWEATTRQPISKLDWSTTDINFPHRTENEFLPDHLNKVLNDPRARAQKRLIAAIILSWINRADRPVQLSRLGIGETSIVHLPGEPFIEYQLFAQSQRKDNFVCVAGYGDGGCGYIPMEASYAEGGYEPTMAFVAPESESLLKAKIKRLLNDVA